MLDDSARDQHVGNLMPSRNKEPLLLKAAHVKHVTLDSSMPVHLQT